MIHLNFRRVHIIDKLMDNAPYPITVLQFAEELACSERTIRYELDIVDDWLQHYAAVGLTRKSNSGIQLNLNQANLKQIREQLASLPMTSYEYNRVERVKLISLMFLTTQKPLTISRMENIFNLSRGTVLKDLDATEDFLGQFSIMLERKPRKGMWLEADELRYRQALTSLGKHLDPNVVQMIANAMADENHQRIQFPPSMSGILDILEVQLVQSVVDPLLRLLDVALSDEGRMTLYLHIGMVLMRTKSNRPINMDTGLSDIHQKKEYKIAEIITRQIEKAFEIALPEEEIAYIALHILGKQSSPLLPVDDGESDGKLESIIKQMTLHVEKLLQVYFKHKQELNQGLLLHIQPAIYRVKYGLVLENTLVQEVKKEYKQVFDAVRIAVLPLEHTYQIALSDKEVAYIAMHYGGKLYEPLEEHHPISIILVCSSGLGTANLLKGRIKSLFTNIEIIHVLSRKLFMEKSDWNANLIISTIDLPVSGIPQLKVNPLLPENDYKRLSNYLTLKEQSLPSAQHYYEAVWPIIQQYCTIENSIQLTEELMDAFQMVMGHHKIGLEWGQEPCQQVLEKEMIQLDVHTTHWREAIQAGVRPLQRYGINAEKYSQEIITIMEEQGPYMAVAPGIMLAHGSKKELTDFALSFTRLDPPIAFGHEGNDPIVLLFVFAAPDGNQHLVALQQLLESLLEKKNREALCAVKTAEEVLEILEIQKDNLTVQGD